MLVSWLTIACSPVPPEDGTGAWFDTDTGVDTGDDTHPGVPTEGTVRLATWNLHVFSERGRAEPRARTIASKLEELDLDIVAVQELWLADPSGTYQGEEAWDELLDELPHHAGVTAPWRTWDSTVGLLYDTETTELISSEVLWEDDSNAFPRPPLRAVLSVTKDGIASEIEVVVLHLKAEEDGLARRRAAAEELDQWLDGRDGAQVLLVGDLNDDPNDPTSENAFEGTLLEPDYAFLSYEMLPATTSTYTGFGREVDGTWVEGSFLDHAVATRALYDARSYWGIEVASVPVDEYDAFSDRYSDHFPLVVEIGP